MAWGTQSAWSRTSVKGGPAISAGFPTARFHTKMSWAADKSFCSREAPVGLTPSTEISQKKTTGRFRRPGKPLSGTIRSQSGTSTPTINRSGKSWGRPIPESPVVGLKLLFQHKRIHSIRVVARNRFHYAVLVPLVESQSAHVIHSRFKLDATACGHM